MHDGFHVYHFYVPHHWNEDDCENHLGRKTHVSSNGYSNRKHGLIKEIIKCLMKHQLSLAYYMCGIFRSPSWATSWSLLSEDGSHCTCPLPTDGPCLVEQNKKKKSSPTRALSSINACTHKVTGSPTSETSEIFSSALRRAPSCSYSKIEVNN